MSAEVGFNAVPRTRGYRDLRRAVCVGDFSATFDPVAELLENDHFGVYIEQEPYVRELIDAYMGSRFKTVLEILDRFSVCLPSHPVYSYVLVLTCNYGRLDVSWTSS